MPSLFSRSANDHYKSTDKVANIAKRFVKNVLLYKYTLYRGSIKYSCLQNCEQNKIYKECQILILFSSEIKEIDILYNYGNAT